MEVFEAVALTDERGPAAEQDQGGSAGGFDRQPPQDRGAEQSVLGGMLLSKDAIADVVEVLHPGDFYRPAHQAVFDCILDLYGRGEPADPITVSAELERRGELGRVGGAPYLHTLIATVPTAANAGYYAEIVAQKAVLRRLVEAGTRIVQYGYGGANSDGAEVNEIVDRAQAAIYEVTERRTSEDFIPLEELLQPTMDEIDAIASRGGTAQGVPTGFTDLDELTNGLHAGQMIIVAARPGIGKALALDTPLPTSSGWTSMGEVAVGDQLLGADGKPTTVVAATDIMQGRPCYELNFSDGSTIVADAQHQWLTDTSASRQAGPSARTTEQIATSVDDGHRIPEAHEERARQIVDVQPVPSAPVRCVEVDASDHLYLAGRSMIPTHNSTLGLDFARACSIKGGMTSVIFSLEMGRTEIVMRMLSAEAKIRLQDMRGGRMSDDDWTRLARRMSEISEAPLFIDDSPNMTMMEIRAKARRLKQRNDLQLIVVDYMQLMTSGKKVESRQQEVSEFSRQLKLLAKELEVPVVAISQLNRGPEQRTDKRPMLADLRESGCLTSRTRILRADTGTETTIGELLDSGELPVVWSLDERLRMVPRQMTKVFPSGVKEVFRLRLASGREVEASGNHPFLTVDGWVPLEDLSPGDRLAVPREVPQPGLPEPLPEAEVTLLGHLIGDGSFVRRQPVRYASKDEANLQAVSEAAEHFGITAVRDDCPAARCTSLRLPAPFQLTHGKRNPIAAWLDELGLFGVRSHEKFIPGRVFRLPNDQIAQFINHLWATDGSVRWDATAGMGRIYYASTSRRLVDDLAQLLLRVGVQSRIKRAAKVGYRDGWHLLIYGAENQLRFLKDVGVHGEREETAREVADNLHGVVGNTNLLDDADLELLATNDVFWDEITEITSLGEQPVYDATVPGTHNFVANGIHVHNSLEQDADIVLLVSRPDAFERDDPRAGEADLILAKHRSGPVNTVTVAHQLHYSRFADLAQE